MGKGYKISTTKKSSVPPEDKIRQHMDFDKLMAASADAAATSGFLTTIANGKAILLGSLIVTTAAVSYWVFKSAPYPIDPVENETKLESVAEHAMDTLSNGTNESVTTTLDDMSTTIPEKRVDDVQKEAIANFDLTTFENAEPIIGYDSLYKFIAASLQYPEDRIEEGVQGTVKVRFVIDSTGSVTNLNVIAGITEDFDSEAKRVIAMMPKWKPASMNDQPVASKMIIPIGFRLTKPAGDTQSTAEDPNSVVVDFDFQNAEPTVGYDSMYAFIASNLKYPPSMIPDSIEGTVRVRFVIGVTGNVIQTKVVESLDFLFDVEAERVIRRLPKWKAATLNGKPIKSKMEIPLRFKVD
ncbi:MAG: energy transducer TonB [Cyclobacteriaceae bacterium]